MRAVILAAGRGSRMGNETELLPKGMTTLAGHPLLRWQIESLRQAGVTNIALVSGYRREALEEFSRKEELYMFYNSRWASTNMVMSLMEADPWMGTEPCLVSYADIAYSVGVARRLAEFPSCDLAVAYDVLWRELWEMRSEDPLSDAETFSTDSSGRLLEIGKRARSLDDIHGQYLGLVRWTPLAWRRAVELIQADDGRDRLDMTSLLQRLIEARFPVQAVPIDGEWCEVDSASDRARYEERLSAGGWSHDFRGVEVLK